MALTSRKIVAILMVALGTGLTCASNAGPVASPTGVSDRPTAEEILSRAGGRFESLQSFHFVMTHEGGTTSITLGLEMDEAEGDILAPDRMAVTVQAKASGVFFEVSVVAVGDGIYMTNPFTRLYEDISEAKGPQGFFDPAKGIGTIISKAIGPMILAEESLDKVAVYHLAGQVRSEDLRDISPSAVAGFMLSAEIWIDMEDFLIRKLLLIGRMTPDEKEAIARTILLSGYDRPVTIEAPEVGSRP